MTDLEKENLKLRREVLALREGIDYLFNEKSTNSGSRIIDVAYTSFMMAHEPNPEDGGPSDWMTDTRPRILEGLTRMRNSFLKMIDSETKFLNTVAEVK